MFHRGTTKVLVSTLCLLLTVSLGVCGCAKSAPGSAGQTSPQTGQPPQSDVASQSAAAPTAAVSEPKTLGIGGGLSVAITRASVMAANGRYWLQLEITAKNSGPKPQTIGVSLIHDSTGFTTSADKLGAVVDELGSDGSAVGSKLLIVGPGQQAQGVVVEGLEVSSADLGEPARVLLGINTEKNGYGGEPSGARSSAQYEQRLTLAQLQGLASAPDAPQVQSDGTAIPGGHPPISPTP